MLSMAFLRNQPLREAYSIEKQLMLRERGEEQLNEQLLLHGNLPVVDLGTIIETPGGPRNPQKHTHIEVHTFFFCTNHTESLQTVDFHKIELRGHSRGLSEETRVLGLFFHQNHLFLSFLLDSKNSKLLPSGHGADGRYALL